MTKLESLKNELEDINGEIELKLCRSATKRNVRLSLNTSFFLKASLT